MCRLCRAPGELKISAAPGSSLLTMEEADGILFLALRQIECKIPDSVTTVKEVTSEVLVSIVSRCLSLITEGEAEFPSRYMSACRREHAALGVSRSPCRCFAFPLYSQIGALLSLAACRRAWLAAIGFARSSATSLRSSATRANAGTAAFCTRARRIRA